MHINKDLFDQLTIPTPIMDLLRQQHDPMGGWIHYCDEMPQPGDTIVSISISGPRLNFQIAGMVLNQPVLSDKYVTFYIQTINNGSVTHTHSFSSRFTSYWKKLEPKTVSDPVEKFAQAMQQELDINSHKGDWRDMDLWKCLYELQHHVSKLTKALAEDNPQLIREHSADCGNSAMFIYTLFGGSDGSTE